MDWYRPEYSVPVSGIDPKSPRYLGESG